MASGRYSFTIEQGSTVNFSIIYKDSTGSPIDLTSYNSKMQIKPYLGAPTTIATLSSSLNVDGTGLDMSNAVSGSIGVYISSCTSSLFTFDEAVYDLDIVSGSSCPVVNRILEGKIKLSKEVTVL